MALGILLCACSSSTPSDTVSVGTRHAALTEEAAPPAATQLEVERDISHQLLKKLGLPGDQLIEPLDRITGSAVAGQIDEQAIQRVVALAPDAGAAANVDRILRSYAASVAAGTAHIGSTDEGIDPTGGAPDSPGALVSAGEEALAGVCLNCPAYNFGPFTPTTTYQTHDGTTGSALGDCNRYLFNVVPGRQYEFTTCSPGSNGFDTIIQVQQQGTCSVAAVNDDACGVGSRVTYTVPAGVTQLNVQVRGYNSRVGSYRLAYREVPPAITCSNPRSGTYTPATTCQTLSGTVDSNQDNYYQFNLTAGMTYEFSTCPNQGCPGGTATFDTVVEVYSPTCSLVASNDDSSGCTQSLSSYLRYTPTVSGIHRVRVRGYSGSIGSFVLSHSVFVCTPPTVTALQPTVGVADATCGANPAFTASLLANASPGMVSFSIASPEGASASPASESSSYGQSQTAVSFTSRVSPSRFGLCGAANFQVTATAQALCSAQTSSLTSTYTLVDRTPPIMICPRSRPVACDDPLVTTHEGARAFDNCDFTVGAVVAGEERLVPPPPVPRCSTNFDLVRTYVAEDCSANSASCSQVLAVRDTTPPSVTPGPDRCLWPPDHKMACYTVAQLGVTIADTCSSLTSLEIASCSSNQPDNGTGDGNTTGDCQISADRLSVCVRAERAGNGPTPRVYTIVGVARDDCGNASEPTPIATISVPHNNSGKSSCDSSRQRVAATSDRRIYDNDDVFE